MRLHHAEREYYRPIVVPPGLPYELSVDRGQTWHVADVTRDGQPSFLVRGPDYRSDEPGDNAGLLVACSIRPLIRVKDHPEVLILSGPWIILWRE